MGKRTNEPSDKDDTRILFKKSISSIRTHSRTYSGQSQTFTRSGMIHVKKNISEANTYYFNSGKEKKDLSIETDVCILRRYYKNKLNKLACREGLSTNRSVKDAEITTSNIEQKFEAGDSADNLKNVDVVTLIVENFKDLLNKWIREYILNNENLQKMETVRDSLLHRLELNSLRENTSNSTFVHNSKNNKCKRKGFNKIKKKKKHITKRKDRPKAVVKCSCYTIPFQCKNVRIISTLSIPRNFDKSAFMNKDSNGHLMYRINKVSRRNIFVSLKKSEDLYVDSSTFNLLAISSRSFTKRCVTYNDKSKKKEIIKRNIAYQPRGKKNSTESTISMETETNSIPKPDFRTNAGFDPLPSLVKNIYGDIAPKTNTSYFFLKNDNFTMTDHVSSRILSNTGPASSESNECRDFKYCKSNIKNSDFSSEKNSSDPMVTIDFIGRSLEFPPLDSSKLKNTLKNISKRSSHRNNRDAKKRNFARLKKYTENNSNLSSVKDFTYLYNKVNKRLTDDSEFLGHFQDIFKYIAGRDGQNVRLDVHVNVYPFADYKAKPENEVAKIRDNQASYSVTCNSTRRNLDTLIECQETEPISTKESKGSKSIDSPEIITLLDGAASQAKYIVMSENEGAVKDTSNQIFSNLSESSKVSEHTKVSENTQMSKHTVSDNTQVSGRTIASDNTKVTECQTANTVEIANEINELKNVIQSLAVTTEKLMNEHMKGKKKKVQKRSQGETTILYNYTVAGTTTEKSETLTLPNEIEMNQSKGVYVTQNMLNNDDFSGLKVKMDPKRPEVGDIHARLTERSTTYHIIDSESVLKITDMTSHANNSHGPGPNDVGITCSIPDSESYFETPVEKENNLLTFFCDGCSGKYRPLSNPPSRRSNLCRSELSCRGCGTQPGFMKMFSKNNCSCCDLGVQCYQMISKCDGITRMEDDCCKVLPRRRNCGCYEGLAYCVMLLLVPFAFLSVLFYLLVVQKGYLNRSITLKTSKDLPGYKPSDLGF